MIRAMSSALSGLRNHQLMLDVVGNDIANVSTVGFKSSTPIFSDLLIHQNPEVPYFFQKQWELGAKAFNKLADCIPHAQHAL